MLTSIELTIKGGNGSGPVTHHFGSLLHGALMEKVSSQYADFLHYNSLRPFSQFVYYDYENRKHVWKINTLDEEAGRCLIEPLLDSDFKSIRITQKSMELQIENKQAIEPVSFKQLADRYFIGKSPERKVVINFLSPTTFKTEGEYAIFPNMGNIYGSLLSRWNSFYREISLEDEHILEHLIDHTKIIGYKLKSTKFGLEKARISSFVGDICIYISGPDPLLRIAHLLLGFGAYSGIGAKTALGMGGIKIG